MGEVFAGRYELADPVGRGGVGAVWRAWDHRRRRYVAAKILQQRDAHALLRFVREQALRIDHPHVLAPASWAADDDKVLFTMDLVAGGSLVHLVGDYGPLPPAFVCTLLDQLLSGLAAVHAEGVVHRDIKPANVLLEATGTARPRLRLSDFGVAMRLGEPRLTETDHVVGTPGYLAPEQLLGTEPDFPSDLFAVGLVALYLLQGAKPDTRALVEHFTSHGTPGAPHGVPGPLWEVVATLLQPDPAARFRTATGARKALASARELLPEPGGDDESVEIFDQLGPLPPGFGPQGPLGPPPGRGMGAGDGPSGTQHGSSGVSAGTSGVSSDFSGSLGSSGAHAGAQGLAGTQGSPAGAHGSLAGAAGASAGAQEFLADAAPPCAGTPGSLADAAGPSAGTSGASPGVSTAAPGPPAAAPDISAAAPEISAGAPSAPVTPGAPGTGSGAADAASGASGTTAVGNGTSAAIPPRPTTAPTAPGSTPAAASRTPLTPPTPPGSHISSAPHTPTALHTPPPPLAPGGPHTPVPSPTGPRPPVAPPPGISPPPGTGGTAPDGGPPHPAGTPQVLPPGIPPRPAGDPTPASRPLATPDTGGFPLPPPPPPGEVLGRTPWAAGQPPTQPATVLAPAPVPAYTAPVPLHEPTYVPVPGPRPAPGTVARSPDAPTRPQRTARHGRRAAPRRAGPPAKIAVPVLLLALVCYAVGFWALSRI
ncbi:protein kinase [Streptomyces sp. NPDC052040]|uniref:serine/threonine-protein kinase n=1 Tax=Streptomyces sp. NPDC052040 TaxID=3365682 RepID=UPI0037D1D999